MPQVPNPSAEVREAAIVWLVRRDARALTAAESAEFEVWSADPANARAYDHIQTLWAEIGQASRLEVQPGRRRTRPPDPRPASLWPVRWRFMVATAAAMAAGMVLAWLGPVAWISMTADAQTGVGQIRKVALADGSSVTLDARSAVSLAYASNQRSVRLLRGQAVFHVAPDPRRPFLVECAGGETRAIGTIFVVRREAGGAVVTGVEHRIAVTFPVGASGAAYVLGPGQTIAYGQGGALSGPHPAANGADAFERGELVFEDRPLAFVVAELNRYRRGKILLAGEVGAMTVSGVFRTDDPASALAAVQTRLGLKSASFGKALIILYK